MRRAIISKMCIAALVLAASCSKIEESTPSVERDGKTVINGVAGSIGTGTKADMTYCYDVIWREGDRIYVTDGKTDDTFTLSGGAGSNKGQFTEDNTKGVSGDIEAFYPASLKTGDGYVWPATQSNSQAVPMYAEQMITGEGNDVISFSSLGAMLQIVFSTMEEGITITSVTLKDSSKPLSGTFTVDGGQAIMDGNPENPGVTLDLGDDGVPVGVAARYFYIDVPAGSYYGDNLTLTFIDDIHNKECVMNSTTFPDIERNTVGRITLAGKKFKSHVQETRGTAMRTGEVEVNWVQLWDGGPRFAEYNVGAENNRAEDYGSYYCWGKTTDKDASETYYNGYSALAGNDDTAINLWGSNWRMPTAEEFTALLENCTCTWTTDYNGTGINGILCTGKDGTAFASNSIFFPAAGCWSNGEVKSYGNYGYYWSSTAYRSTGASALTFYTGEYPSYLDVSNRYRGLGCSIRAVLNE